MSETYGEFPGVNVSVRDDDKPPTAAGRDLDEEEYQLATICIWMTIDTEGEAWGIDQNAAANALECYGYSQYESRPMVWTTLEEIVNRVEQSKHLSK